MGGVQGKEHCTCSSVEPPSAPMITAPCSDAAVPLVHGEIFVLGGIPKLLHSYIVPL